MKTQMVMPYDGESAGTVEVVIDKSESGLVATFTYRPADGTEPPQKMLLGYRDAMGGGNMRSMDKQEDGSWVAKRDIKPNESSQFFMHPNVTAEEAPYRANIVGKVSLEEGNLVEDVTENPELTDAEKGQVKKYVYQQDGKIVGPVEDEYILKTEEKLVEIYFPRGFEHSQQKTYDFQVMLDGDMHLRQDVFSNRMNTKTILDNLIAEEKMEPTVVAFVSPTAPTMQDGECLAMPRLREYGCNSEAATFLARLPEALRQSGIPISAEPNKTGICGQSLGGLQALYTAKMHPDVYGQVIAQSPAVWWGPNVLRLAEKQPERPVRYEDDETWRAPLANEDEQQYLLSMIQKKHDVLTGNAVPEGDINIQLQAGTHETGDCGLGDEPLTQATQRLAEELGITCKIHDGGHSADAWATGLSVSLPNAHPSRELQQSRSPHVPSVGSGDPTLTADSLTRKVPDSTDLSWLRDVPSAPPKIKYIVSVDPVGETPDSRIAIFTKVMETLGHTLEITPSADVVKEARESAEVPPVTATTESQATTAAVDTDEVKADTVYRH